MAATKWRLLWSDETYTLSDVVKNTGIPVLVKVGESIYELHDERFTPGDLLQIHSKKTVNKVVCRVIQSGDRTPPVSKRKQTGTLAEDDISIPIEYKQKLSIYHRDAGCKVYQTVSELVKERPRYVRVIDSFTDRGGYTINARSDIELGQVGKGGALSFFCDGYTYNVNPEQPIKCLLLPDDTKYTIQELIDKFPLPQTVEFSEAESSSKPRAAYTGVKGPSIEAKYIEIKSVIKQDVYICTLNPSKQVQGPNSEKGKKGSKMIIIPLDSVTNSQLEVKIPQQPDDSNYGAMLGKIRPKMDAAMTAIEETIDTVNYPKVLFIPMQKDKPKPPVPSKPTKRTPSNTYRRASTQSRNKEPDDDDDSDYEPIAAPPPIRPNPGPKITKPKPPQVLPKARKTSSNPLPSKEEINDPSLYSPQTEGGIKYEDEDDHPYDLIKDEKWESIPDRRPKSESDSVENTLAKVPMMVRESLLKVQAEFRNFWNNQTTSQTSGDDQKASETKLRKSMSLPSRFDDKFQKQNEKPSVSESGPLDHGDSAKPGIASKARDKFRKFLNDRKIRDPKEKKPPTKSKFSDMDTGDLAKYLRRCDLNAMADCVEEEKLNGRFFMDIPNEDLESTFGLNKIQILKFIKMRDVGWEPNT